MQRLSRSFSRSSRASKGDGNEGDEEVASPRRPSAAAASPRRSGSFVRALSSFRSSSSVARSSDDDVKLSVSDLVSVHGDLLVTLLELEKTRDDVFLCDCEAFLSSQGFQDALQEIQSCQRQLKDLLANATRVQALCPEEYPELLRLNVELMTTFSRVAGKPEDAEDAPQSITENGRLRHRSLSASL